MRTLLAGVMMICAANAAGPGSWSAPAEVRSDDNLCLTYRARLDGSFLVISAKVEPGWHTFAMDNKIRAEEKLAGKKSLGIDQPTEFRLTGLEAVGPWFQTAPKDFSKPQLRWFSWGFEKDAVFAAKVKRAGAGGAAKIGVRGQACTDVTCKNIDAALTVPLANPSGEPSGVNLKELVQVH
jgi:hypothetical protein